MTSQGGGRSISPTLRLPCNISDCTSPLPKYDCMVHPLYGLNIYPGLVLLSISAGQHSPRVRLEVVEAWMAHPAS
jgi:hypothetical protein